MRPAWAAAGASRRPAVRAWACACSAAAALLTWPSLLTWPPPRLPAPTGPLFRTFTYQWLPERYAPIVQENLGRDVVITCPQDTKVLVNTPE